MVRSVSIAVATTLFHYAHDYHYQKATTISNFFAPIVELLSDIEVYEIIIVTCYSLQLLRQVTRYWVDC